MIEVSAAAALPEGVKSQLIKGLRRWRTDVIPRMRPIRTEQARRRHSINIFTDWLDTTYSGLSRAAVEKMFEADLVVAHSTLLADRMVKLCPRGGESKIDFDDAFPHVSGP